MIFPAKCFRYYSSLEWISSRKHCVELLLMENCESPKICSDAERFENVDVFARAGCFVDSSVCISS